MKDGYGFWLVSAVAFLILINAASWLMLIDIGGSFVKLLGLGILAYTLGLRHAFDADHIAAIDNTTRKMVQEGKRPVGVGLFFSLGHSTVVMLLALAIVFAGSFVSSNIPSLAAIGSVLGTGISALFLYIIGIINIFIFVDIYKTYRKLEVKKYDETEVNRLLSRRGFMNRIFGRRIGFVRSSWQMYPVGFLFGLGFDTASEITLLAITAIAASNMPIIYVMVLPIMFTAGMTLLDTADGIIMLHAYNWASKSLISKMYYNMAITAASILVAFFVGGIEWLRIVGIELGLRGGIWSAMQNLDFGTLGIMIVGILVGTWIISMFLYRKRRAVE